MSVPDRPDAPEYVHAVLPEEILRQRALKWPGFHPEDFCHRCGRRNPNWHADGELWDAAVHDRPRGVVDILCPSCFAELFEDRSHTSCSWEMRLVRQRDLAGETDA